MRIISGVVPGISRLLTIPINNRGFVLQNPRYKYRDAFHLINRSNQRFVHYPFHLGIGQDKDVLSFLNI